VLDDDLCGMARRYCRGFTLDDETLGLASIMNVGHDGNYLKDPMTLERCRTEFWDPATFTRDSVQNWIALDKPDAMTQAFDRAEELLGEYVRPEIDPGTEARITSYVGEAAID
jgi:trimethylamine--corrinoid protein Co-methyltransferase